MTSEWMLHASASFPMPYRSLSRVREVLAELAQDGVLGRAPMLEDHQGQRRWLYFLAPGAKRILPDLAALRAGSGPYRAAADPLGHSLAVAEFVAHAHRSAGQSGGRVRILEGLRDGSLRTNVRVATRDGELITAVVPDHTLLVEVDGLPQLLLLEMQNCGAVILPGSPQSVRRSFRFKLAKHKALVATFRTHPVVQRMITGHGPLAGFRTLVVAARGETSMRHLLSAASGYTKLFYFATLEQTRRHNLFLDPFWTLPGGRTRAVSDW
jgi:hypothetical protein